MLLGDVHGLVERVGSLDAGGADRVVLEAAIGDLRRLKSWVEAREVAFARRIADLSSFPEKSLADAGRSTLRQAEQVLRRGEVIDELPEFSPSLDAGRVTGEHVDILGRALRQLAPAARDQLVQQAPRLLLIAENSTADEFARTVRDDVRRLEHDGDADARLERQRRAVRLNTWLDRDTGMGRWSATWDPETMLRLENRLDARVQALFHDHQPDGCPTDLLEKQSYLRALALRGLLDGNGPRLGRPEIVVVVDHTRPRPDGQPTIDWGLPVELPKRVLDDLARTAKTYTVVVRNGVIIDAPGELNLGRTTRLANRAQRRALGTIYATCAIPGCCVRLQPHQTSPRHLVAPRRPQRHRQLPARLRTTPPHNPQRPLAAAPRTKPHTHHHTPRRHHHDHRPTQTKRRLTAGSSVQVSPHLRRRRARCSYVARRFNLGINPMPTRVSDTSWQMLRSRDQTRTEATVAETVATITRATTWQLVDELPLRFDARHPQGMARVGSTWWISTVDIAARRGLVMVVDDGGELIEQIPVGDQQHYHPGGMDFDGSAFWIPCAEYRPNSSTTVYRLEPGDSPEPAFEVDDHVGALARCGAEGDLVGWSWGSRRFYRWSVDGRLDAVRINPAFFVDHQDCQWLDSGHLLCGGVAEVGLSAGPGWLGGLGLLDVDQLVMQREVPFPIYSTATGRVATHNPLWAEVSGDQLLVHLLPDDGMGAILSYATPLADRTGSDSFERVDSSVTAS